MPSDGTYRSICTLCHSGCGIVVDIRNGRMASVKPDVEHPSNRRYLCRKIAAIEELSTSPDRIRQPLMRRGEDFVPISWDEAYDLAAEKLSSLLKQFGPDAVMRCSGAPVSYDARDGFNYLMRVMGSANATGSSAYCMVPRVTAFVNAIGGKPEPDFDNADYIILWGSNPKATNRLGGYCAFDGIQMVLDRARNRGSRIVFIDPVRCESIEDGDLWVKVRPGTDVVLAMGMLRHIINNDLYDHDFVENYTIGFEELRKGVQKYTPEYIETVTGVPEGLMTGIAEDFAKAERATICEGNGLDMYANTVYSVQAVAALCGITGRIDRKGGLVFLPFIPQAPINNLNPATMRQKFKYPLFRDIPFPAVKESLLAGDDDAPRAMIIHHANPVLINANSDRTFEALRKLDFLLVCDIFMTATARAADLIIPDKTAFESFGYKAYTSFDRPFVSMQRPLFDAPQGMNSVFRSEYEIAKRMGLGDRYPFTDEESWIRYALGPSGITFEDLLEKQIVFQDKLIVYEKYRTNGFRTPSGKMELASSRQADNGYSPIPIEIPGNPAIERMKDRYPLIVINYRPAEFVHTKLHNLKSTTRLHPKPFIWMNRENMKRYDLEEGDAVRVETRFGQATFFAKLRKDLDDINIMLEFGWGNPTDSGADINALTGDTIFDPISGGTPNRLYRARISKA